MSEASVDGPSLEVETPEQAPSDGDERVELYGAVSAALSVVSFLTLLKLADRRDRSPFRALSLFVATTTESITATVLGATAVSQARESDRPSRGMVLGAAGTVLGIITTLLNFNWMRTRRRL